MPGMAIQNDRQTLPVREARLRPPKAAHQLRPRNMGSALPSLIVKIAATVIEIWAIRLADSY
jgi:hypothetical protein